MPSALNGCSCRISERDSSGATTENDGFSVVAATNSTTRFSTAASSASCCLGKAVHLIDEQHRLVAVRGGRPGAPLITGANLLIHWPTAPRAFETAARGAGDQRGPAWFMVPGGPYRMTDAPEPSTRRRRVTPAEQMFPADHPRRAIPAASDGQGES